MKTTTIPKISGPYHKDISWTAVAISMVAHAFIGIILAVSVVGMTGALDEPVVLACIDCAGGVGR